VNQSGLPGTFTFSGDTTGSALGDYMLGVCPNIRG